MRTNRFCFVSLNLSTIAAAFFYSHDAHLSSPPHPFSPHHTLSFSHSRDSYFLLSGAVACERCVLMGRKSRMFTFGCVGAFLLPLWLASWFISQEYALIFTLFFSSNSLCICMQMPWKRATCISRIFPNKNSIFLSLSRTSWGLGVKSLCRKRGRPVCICDPTVYRLFPRKEITRRHTWAELNQNLQWIER